MNVGDIIGVWFSNAISGLDAAAGWNAGPATAPGYLLRHRETLSRFSQTLLLGASSAYSMNLQHTNCIRCSGVEFNSLKVVSIVMDNRPCWIKVRTDLPTPQLLVVSSCVSAGAPVAYNDLLRTSCRSRRLHLEQALQREVEQHLRSDCWFAVRRKYYHKTPSPLSFYYGWKTQNRKHWNNRFCICFETCGFENNIKNKIVFGKNLF